MVAAHNPITPPPQIRTLLIRSSLLIEFWRTTGCDAIPSSSPVKRGCRQGIQGRQLPPISLSNSHLEPSKRAILAFLHPIRADGDTLMVTPDKNIGCCKPRMLVA